MNQRKGEIAMVRLALLNAAAALAGERSRRQSRRRIDYSITESLGLACGPNRSTPNELRPRAHGCRTRLPQGTRAPHEPHPRRAPLVRSQAQHAYGRRPERRNNPSDRRPRISYRANCSDSAMIPGRRGSPSFVTAPLPHVAHTRLIGYTNLQVSPRRTEQSVPSSSGGMRVSRKYGSPTASLYFRL